MDKNADEELFDACEHNNVEKAREAIEKGANVNAKDKDGSTPLMIAVFMIAAFNGNVELAKLLIERKADVNAKDNNGWTPLIEAAFHGNVELVKLLIKAGADVNAKNNYERTALDIAYGELKEGIKPYPYQECIRIIKEAMENRTNLFSVDIRTEKEKLKLKS